MAPSNTATSKTPYIVDMDHAPIIIFTKIHEVIPERLQAKIVHLRDEHDRLQWLVGDLFNEIYSYVKANQVEATRADCANYLLYVMGLEDQRSYSSVLIDAATAAFYSGQARKDYSVLPFSHFRFAAGFAEQSRMVLETALNFFDQYNRPPSIKWLQRQYSAQLLHQAAEAAEPGASITPAARAATSGTYGEGPTFEGEPQGEPVERVRWHVAALRGAVARLSDVDGKIIAQIVTLCDRALDEL
jgi:hypothetical protein